MLNELNSNSDLVNRKSLKDEIFEILQNRVIAGKYHPGEWLRQEEISSNLGVSQTPVREALDLLVSSGLAEREPYRGVRVLHLSDEEIAESFSMRMFLETASIVISAPSTNDQDLQILADIVDQTKTLLSLNDMSLQRTLNRDFHNKLVEVSGNSLLVKMHSIVINTFPDWMLYEYMFRHPELLEENLIREYHEHKAIVDALSEHDVNRSKNELINHFINLRNELIEFLGIEKELFVTKEISI